MFKKGLGIFLALLIAVSVCSCAVQRTEGAEENALTSGYSLSQESASETTSQGQTTQQADSEKQTGTKNVDKTTTKAEKAPAANRTQTTAGTSAKANTQGAAKQKSAGKKSSGSKTENKTENQGETGQQTTSKAETTTVKDGIFVTFTINCSIAVGKADGVPSSGYFLTATKVNVEKNASVYAALCKACSENGISLTATNTMYGMYVSAIGGLAEKEVGKYSGWKYMVNGVYPSKACDKIDLEEGDDVVFIYAKN